MPSNSQETLFFKIGDSNRLKQLGYALHGIAVVACWLANLPIFIQWFLTVSIICFAVFNTPEPKIVYLRYTKNQGWQVSWDGMTFLTAIILDTTVITSVVMFLHLRNEYSLYPQRGQKEQEFRAVVIAKDSLSTNDYRRLMVKLKLCGRNQS